MTGGWRACLCAALLALCLVLAGGATAQSPPPAPGETALADIDYRAWGQLVDRVETLTADAATPTAQLERSRALVVEWRSAFQAARGGNASRIDTLRDQIGVLGPVPADGAAEAPEIAERRKQLSDQLVELQAPVIAADEAHSQADGLIREIDRVVRARQADEFLRLWPMPVNPANWPEAVEALADTLQAIGDEIAGNWADPGRRAVLAANLPLIVVLVIFALAATLRGGRWVGWLLAGVEARVSGRWHAILALLVSLGRIVVPTAGIYALATALTATDMLGPLGTVLTTTMVGAGFVVAFARWLALQVFPRGEGDGRLLRLPSEDRRRGRFLLGALGFLIAVEALRQSVMDPAQIPEAATSVLTFPIFALMSGALFHLGRLLKRHAVVAQPGGEAASFRVRMTGLAGNVAIVVAVAGLFLAAVGYVAAGAGLVMPAVISLSLIAVLEIVQTLIDDVHAVLAGNLDGKREALFPVLAGFALVLASLPVFAVIWGARVSDIAELFTRLGEGFAIGATTISPASFLTFAAVFAIGYLTTQLFQGALRAMILPKTTLDLGSRNAVAAGTGYLGVFFSALIAVNAAGIDLSGLALIAGGLSLGIGIGLQNIVQNFISGIILLVERPVSEGDWIEVGTTQGIVKAISVRSTRIQTFDRNDVIVPNADLVSGRVTNWTRFNLTGRLIVPVAVVHGSDTRKVDRVLRGIAEAQPLAILNPPPLILFTGFGANALNFEIRVILRDVNFSLNVRNEINHQIAERFAAEGIAMPTL